MNTAISISNNSLNRFINACESKQEFEKQIRDHQNKYNTDDIFYGFDGSKCIELTEGYFYKTLEFESLDDALKAITTSNVVRVVNEQDDYHIEVGKYSKSIQTGADSCVNIANFNIIY